MSKNIARLLKSLTVDSWRMREGFSEDITKASRSLYEAENNDQRIRITNSWLERHQPCLFGVIAARLGLISYCFLTEDDLVESDLIISEKIQSARSRWTSEAFEGKKSAFIIAVISERIALATPDKNLKNLSKSICSRYLQAPVKTNKIYLDNIFLERKGRTTAAWMWETGINYFSSQGDRRWWHDHRFPGGLAFSVNSVGHMVKSGKISTAMAQLDTSLGLPSNDWELSKVDSLEKALQLAMSTIARASNAVSGKATELLPKQPSMKCPASLPTTFDDKNCRQYHGFYHTDYTLPEEYFVPDVERPVGIKEHILDFTYLFDKRLDNPDFVSMGEGRRIRRVRRSTKVVGQTLSDKVSKRKRGVPVLVSIDKQKRLFEALNNR